MEIINRINIRDTFIITPLNDEYGTVTLRGKNSKDGTGDVVIHRNKEDPNSYDIKIIVTPLILDELNQMNTIQSFLGAVANELIYHKSIYQPIIDKPISMFVKPYIYTMMTTQDLESLYLFYTAVSSVIRMMYTNVDNQCVSGMLH